LRKKKKRKKKVREINKYMNTYLLKYKSSHSRIT
jgi:hypothetical protein